MRTRRRATTSPRNDSVNHQDSQRWQEITSLSTILWPCRPSSVKPPGQPPTSPTHLSSLCANRQLVCRSVQGVTPSPARRDWQRAIAKLFTSPLLCTHCLTKYQVNPVLPPYRFSCCAKTSIGAHQPRNSTTHIFDVRRSGRWEIICHQALEESL